MQRYGWSLIWLTCTSADMLARLRRLGISCFRDQELKRKNVATTEKCKQLRWHSKRTLLFCCTSCLAVLG